ncbi:BatD family protein [Moheibacter sediminis]|uniref:LPXTG-motif cell wall anchor domain-containing protein n=1 Tax=Moheibacter sediminis TaxID=1434700 RepID=A0A1W1Y7R2_9FLAO|nr:BatD family protein [Moheibacter sediminis]SMC32193.1 LPXTG-motif cell wall anchor domain-containing protein [Moheibacter sediminis]
MMRGNLCVFFVIFCSAVLWGQEISFTARANKTEVSVNERFSIQFVLSSDERNLRVDQPIKLPDFNGLNQLAESQQSNFQIVNGQILNQSGLEVILVADREGEYTIGAASLVIDGKRYKTKPITITVKQGLKPKVKPNQRLQGVFLTTEVTEENPFVNQEVVLIVKIYARDYSILNRLRKYEEPDFANLVAKFVSEKTDDNIRQEVVNGQTYVSQELARYILFPQKTGKIEIDPFAIEVIISGYYGSEAVQLTSQPISLKVKDLPGNKPKNYSGAVGTYKLNASMSKDEVKANEAVKLEVEIIGSGNLNTIKTPNIELSETIETYAPKRRDAFEARPTGMRGKVVENTVLVPQYGGQYAIGPIRFSYFDPKEEKYVTLATEPMVLKVDGPEPPKNVISKEDSLTQDELITDHQRKDSTASITSFVPQKITEVKDRVVTTVSGNNNWIWIVVAAILALSAFLFFRKKKSKTVPKVISEKRLNDGFKSEIKSKLVQLKLFAQTDNASEFYSLQEEILTQLGMKFTQTNLSDFTENFVASKIADIHSEELAQKWENLLLESKQAKYAFASSAVDLESKHKETETLVQQFFSVK